jgi:hypothetical protein
MALRHNQMTISDTEKPRSATAVSNVLINVTFEVPSFLIKDALERLDIIVPVACITVIKLAADTGRLISE